MSVWGNISSNKQELHHVNKKSELLQNPVLFADILTAFPKTKEVRTPELC